MASLEPEAERLLCYWFGEPSERVQDDYKHRWALWSSDAFDDDMRDEFAGLWEQACSGQLAHWESGSPQTALALIILFDQLSRNLKRGSPDMFAQDDKALHVMESLIARGGHLSLSWPERIFLYLPLLHSERLADQRRGVGMVEELAATAPKPQRADFERHLYLARMHMEDIVRFGRFPHRNFLLGRTSTQEEIAWLAMSKLGYHNSCKARTVTVAEEL